MSVGLYEKYRIKIDTGETALIYLMNDNGIFPPSAWYAGVIRNGYRNFQLEESFLDEAIRHSFDKKEPSEQTVRRRYRQRMTYQHRLVRVPEVVASQRLEKQIERQRQ